MTLGLTGTLVGVIFLADYQPRYANSTSVDAVSGASASSRAIKEAVQDALKQVTNSVTN
ncbi:FMN-binding protein [Lactiplantibacillus pentosus]|uniref:FMN-binding protein n=1 Tax=Lactiplantibacillus pentosus TaxID=1589 RepID=A0AB37RE07_LACPE|nr:FMN-binding protein [Lactiplantibacillus pentosus]RMW48337.1 FMN-binding protein [Lactiplantibacillus pentosus]RMW52474.1 FMN-binding protein [Lactiplantibacillus pentosus]RMW55208.1 FMN-binding protein [Lactiplantibacillus pentosus]